MPCTYDLSAAEIQADKDLDALTAVVEWLRDDVSLDAVDFNQDAYFRIVDTIGDLTLAEDTPILCHFFREWEKADKHAFEATLYNGRDKGARRAADWWEDHQERDRLRDEKIAKVAAAWTPAQRIANLEMVEQSLEAKRDEIRSLTEQTQDALSDMDDLIERLKMVIKSLS